MLSYFLGCLLSNGDVVSSSLQQLLRNPRYVIYSPRLTSAYVIYLLTCIALVAEGKGGEMNDDSQRESVY